MTEPARIIDASGRERVLGNIPAKPRLKWPKYGTTPDTPLIDESKWEGLIEQMEPGLEWPFLPYVHNQGQVGQCNADATVAAIESCRMSQGLPFVKLSPADLYHRINGGVDQGSLLEDGLAESLKGVGTADTCGLIWQGSGQRTASAAERARFKVLEAFICPTPKHCMSAVLSGFRLISGIMWYQNYNVDDQGWLPLKGQGQPGGHAVFGYKPMMRKGASGRIYYGIAHQNSWDVDGWGIGGRGVFPLEAYAGPVGGWWAVRAVTDEGGVVPTP